MNDRRVAKEVSKAQWLAARAELLVAEKAHTKARAELAAKRRNLPRVRIEKTYSFLRAAAPGDASKKGVANKEVASEQNTSPQTLADLFGDHSQLLIYHLMFGPDWEKPCIGCSAWADAINGTTAQFASADARLIAVSRAPREKLTAQALANGWLFPWYSAFGSDFNYDFYASSLDTSPRSSRVVGNAPQGEIVEFDRGENHGVSVFQKDPDGAVFHTYSTYNRGIEALNGAMGYFDLLPKGRSW